MADHERLLRSAFQDCGGHEITPRATRSSSLPEAVRTPSPPPWRAQRALAGILAGGTVMRVRIGIHTGEVTVAAEDRYVGLAVHRAARICAAAQRGTGASVADDQALLEDEEELG